MVPHLMENTLTTHANGKSPAKVLELRFDLPDVWTLAMWECYTSAIAEYNDNMRRSKKAPNAFVGQFYGALALIQAGYVHPIIPEELQPLLGPWLATRTHENTPLQFVNELATKVGGAIAEAINAPLTDYLKVLSDTSPTPSATDVREG